MYYIMRKSYYVMHKLLRYAKNVLRYAAIITLCVVITLCGVTHVSMPRVHSSDVEVRSLVVVISTAASPPYYYSLANYDNNYFTDIGLKFTSKINTTAKYPFQHYLRTPTTSKCNLQNTNADEILNVINKLSTKTSSGHGQISCKILKEMKYIIFFTVTIYSTLVSTDSDKNHST